MENIQHEMVAVNGIKMHVAELGHGPTVLLLHGFPELWYSWRYQIPFLAEHGYRAVAPDMRGYGDTAGAPIDDISSFSMFHLVGDMVALIEVIAPNEDSIFVVGHDWGAYLAWHLCLFRPDKVKALVNMSVHFIPRNPQMDLVKVLHARYGDDHYMTRFQVPGDIEAEFALVDVKTLLQTQKSVKTVVEKIFRYRSIEPWLFPTGKGFEKFPDTPLSLSHWLTKEDVDYYVSKYEQNGYTGPVNYYRNIPKNWELTEPWTGAQVKVPTKFIVGEQDFVYHIPGAKEYIHDGEFKRDVPLLEEPVVVLEGVAHFVNQESADEVNWHIYEFIQKF